ncbi:MAG: TonB-dependent receptor, partial [candidate division Zixibacteria bacterium]|nr:TonB-dependent receptor [candidate division Zixibacteria bacterium]
MTLFRSYSAAGAAGLRLLRVTLALALVCAFASSAIALDYGQVKGVVTDKKTKEPLIGASVAIVGTDMGAITNVDGKYVIRLVPPKVYELKISMLGYAEVTVTDVRVFSELTFEQNVKMVDATTELEGVKIFADAPMIDKFEVSSSTKLQKEQIQHRPVTSVDDLLKTIVGVVTSNTGEIHIRGGRAGEIAFIVDGVNIRDPVGGPGPVQGGVSLVAGSVQEIQVIKDGFDPEYGNALSGVIKITSQTGSPDRTALNLRFITDDFGNASLNKFSRNYDNVRFTLAGPDPFLTSKIFPALGLNFLKDKELTYFFYAEIEKHDGSFNPLDFVTGQSNRKFDGASLLGINVPERLYNNYNLNTNIAFKPRNNLKFILSYQKTFNRTPVFSWSFRDTPGTLTQNERDWQLASLKMTHSLSKDFNYEVILSYKRNEVNFGPGDPDSPGKIVQPDQFLKQDEWESYTDSNNDGVYTRPEPLVNDIPDTTSYGQGLGGPAHTFGEDFTMIDVQSGLSWGNPALNVLLGTSRIRDFQFNDNGQLVEGVVRTDEFEGEFFADLNGNGIWDKGDPFRDTNGNGQYDASRGDRFGEDNPEPFRDGDISLGEPFTDVNGNRVYDPGIDIFIISTGPHNQDLNRNSIYDGPNPFLWTEGIPFVDLNGNGVFDPPNGVYDAGELFVDQNNNGKYDGKDEFLD